MSIKQKIFESTERLFSERGIKRTKLDDIAADCKVSKKTIYTIFESKDDLIYQLFENKIADIEEFGVAFYQNPEIPITQKLVFIIRAIKDYMSLMSLPLLAEVCDHYTNVRELIDQYVDRGIYERFGQLFEEGKLNGDITPMADFETISLAYKDAISGILDLRFITKEQEERQVDQTSTVIYIISSLFRGMLSKSLISEFDEYMHDVYSIEDRSRY